MKHRRYRNKVNIEIKQKIKQEKNKTILENKVT